VIARILEYTEQEGDWMMHLGIRLQVIGGLRFNELVEIRWRDLLLIGEKRVKNTVVAKISKQNCGKFAIGKDVKIKTRTKKFPIDHNTAKVIMYYWDRKRRPHGDHFVFCALRRRRWEKEIGLRRLIYSTYRRRLKKYARRLALRPKALRGS
jgi:integrase